MISIDQVLVGGVPVPDQSPIEAGQHPTGIHVRGSTPADVEQGQRVGAGHVHVLELPVDAGRGLVGVQHLLQVQRGGYVGDERPQPAAASVMTWWANPTDTSTPSRSASNLATRWWGRNWALRP